MTRPIDHALQEIVALRAQRDALASVVVIAWARARDRGYAGEEDGTQAQMLAAGLIEETECEARAHLKPVDPCHRLSDFGREAMQGCDADDICARYRL
jgi:hypothetical protein